MKMHQAPPAVDLTPALNQAVMIILAFAIPAAAIGIMLTVVMAKIERAAKRKRRDRDIIRDLEVKAAWERQNR